MWHHLLPRLRDKISISDSSCWIWTGRKNEAGYGMIRFNGNQNARIHRIVWSILMGPVPEILHHTCGNRLCCNPAHLEPHKNHKEHRKTHLKGYCAKGLHLMSETAVFMGGQRYCRVCRNEARKKRRWKDPEASRAKERAKSRRWREEHPEQNRAYERAYYRAHLEYFAEKNRRQKAKGHRCSTRW